uniref:Cnidarian restricted protein n=1 Tax=Clytia hemisphaerica TaxID=252671 RepID=A0A7M5X952_9CNID|eukprot:TCONS_00048007-protein
MFLYFRLLLFLSFSKYLSNFKIAATYTRENEDKEDFRENDFFDEEKSFNNPKLILSDSIGHLEHHTTNRNKKIDKNPNKADDYVSVGSQNGYNLDKSKVQHLETMKDDDSDEEEYERLDEDWIQKVAADGERRIRRRRRRRRRRRTLTSLPVRLPAPCVGSNGQVCRWLLVNGEFKYVCGLVSTITCNSLRR